MWAYNICTTSFLKKETITETDNADNLFTPNHYLIWSAGLLQKHKFCGISIRCLTLFCLFSNRQLRVILHGKFLEGYQIKVDLLNASCLFQHFLTYTLIKFLTVLSVTLLSILVFLLSTPIMIKHLICDNYNSLILKLNLPHETL